VEFTAYEGDIMKEVALTSFMLYNAYIVVLCLAHNISVRN